MTPAAVSSTAARQIPLRLSTGGAWRCRVPRRNECGTQQSALARIFTPTQSG
jgi:hypothetical protein